MKKPSVKLCPKCRAQNDPNAQICRGCGWRVPIPVAVPRSQKKRRTGLLTICLVAISAVGGLSAIIAGIRAHKAPFPERAAVTSPNPTLVGSQIIGYPDSKIYHRPDCPDYNKVSERNRVSFKTEAEAEAAGYRKARNCQ
jgi:hypothetical protein